VNGIFCTIVLVGVVFGSLILGQATDLMGTLPTLTGYGVVVSILGRVWLVGVSCRQRRSAQSWVRSRLTMPAVGMWPLSAQRKPPADQIVEDPNRELRTWAGQNPAKVGVATGGCSCGCRQAARGRETKPKKMHRLWNKIYESWSAKSTKATALRPRRSLRLMLPMWFGAQSFSSTPRWTDACCRPRLW
jgi:hypothetical protein